METKGVGQEEMEKCLGSCQGPNCATVMSNSRITELRVKSNKMIGCHHLSLPGLPLFLLYLSPSFSSPSFHFVIFTSLDWVQIYTLCVLEKSAHYWKLPFIHRRMTACNNSVFSKVCFVESRRMTNVTVQRIGRDRFFISWQAHMTDHKKPKSCEIWIYDTNGAGVGTLEEQTT
jgi:hypothetical protein